MKNKIEKPINWILWCLTIFAIAQGMLNTASSQHNEDKMQIEIDELNIDHKVIVDENYAREQDIMPSCFIGQHMKH